MWPTSIIPLHMGWTRRKFLLSRTCSTIARRCSGNWLLCPTYPAIGRWANESLLPTVRAFRSVDVMARYSTRKEKSLMQQAPVLVWLHCQNERPGLAEKSRLTKRVPDVWDSAAFSSIFLASSFPCSQTESTPAHTQVTQTIRRHAEKEGNCARFILPTL